jgi:DNA-binding GntR family transcriptional regulator
MFVTNTDRVRTEIESRIVAGLLAPGTTLDEAQLSQMFEVSRTPVREALLQLSAEGFVKIVPRAGIYVVRLSEHELAELIETLAYAEGMCARLVVQRLTAEHSVHLRRLQQDGEHAVKNGDLMAYSDYNKALHERLYASCGNTYLSRQILQIRKRINPYRHDQLKSAERMARSFNEHERLVAALMAHDEELAMYEATHHILSAGRDLYEPKRIADNSPFDPENRGAWRRSVTDMPRVFGPAGRLH